MSESLPVSDAIVFFGATGDLAYKQVFPALQALVAREHLSVPIIGVAKAGWNLEQLRERADQERQSQLTEAQQRADQLSAQLEQERQARLQAEQRATTAEADAQTQREAADELRNIRQVKVKEEARGLVLTLSGSVLFRSGSAELLSTSRRQLGDVADALKKTQNPLLIEGHTDSLGSAQLNEELSYLRAKSVRDYLVDQGVAGDRIRVDGRGKDEPIASNATSEGRANNRRVEIILERGVGGSGTGSRRAPTDTP